MALVGITPVNPLYTTKSPTGIIIGSAVLRAALATTTSYVVTSYVSTAQAHRINVQFTMVWAASTSTEWIVEWSPDGTTFYQSVNYSVTGGVNTALLASNTFAAGASATWLDSYEIQDAFMRLSVKKTGGAGADTLAVACTLLGAP